MRRTFHFAVNPFLCWLADSPLNVFVWIVYLAHILYFIVVLWWERSEFLTPSRLDQARAMSSRMKRMLRFIRA